MDAVAARAGVSKATIYRRWKSKEELISELLDEIADVVQVAQTGDPFEDLIATSRFAAEHGEAASRLLPALQGEATVNEEFGRMFREKLVERRRQQLQDFVRAAIEAGHIRDDVDVEFLADVMFGAVVMRAHILGGEPERPSRVLAPAPIPHESTLFAWTIARACGAPSCSCWPSRSA